MGLLLPGTATEQIDEAVAGHVNLGVGSAARALLERVQDVDRLLVLRDVEDTVLCTAIDSNIVHARITTGCRR